MAPLGLRLALRKGWAGFEPWSLGGVPRLLLQERKWLFGSGLDQLFFISFYFFLTETPEV